jgi:hypothetical protein
MTSTEGSGQGAEARVEEAARVAIAREERSASPAGEWRDRLWYPSAEERRPCCAGIEPTAANRQALEAHCRTQAHVAQLLGVPLLDLRRAVQAARRDRTARPRPEEAHPQPAVPVVGRTQTLVEASQGARRESIHELREEARQLASFLPRLLAADETSDDLVSLLADGLHAVERLRSVVEYCLKVERAYQTAQEVRDMVLELYGAGRESA